MRFSELIGQEQIKEKLLNMVREERIPHALLFFGPEGSGSLLLALNFAMYLSCENRSENDACGVCPSCVKYNKLAHPDLHFVYPVATTKAIVKDPVSDDFLREWREAILENPYITPFKWYEKIGIENKQGNISKNESREILRKLSLKTFESAFKIMVIWMPEKMNLTAANKLLKLIEEPPPGTIFLMVTEDPGQMIPTILSRTQMIRVPAFRDEDLMKALRIKYDPGEEELKNAVKLAGGNFARAVESMETSEESAYWLELFIRIMRLSYSRKFQEIFDWVEEVGGLGRERQKGFLLFALRMIRENYLLNLNQEQLVKLTREEYEFSGNFSKVINTSNAALIVSELNDACMHIEANAYSKIVFLDMALKLVKIIR